MSTPATQRVDSIISDALKVIGANNHEVYNLPITSSDTYTVAIQVYRPFDMHGCKNPRLPLSEYRAFNRKIDSLCTYLEQTLDLHDEITVKEIQNEQKDQDHFHSVAIVINAVVS